MNRDDMNRWESEIDSWRQRYEALLKVLADQRSLMPPMLLGDKESYELGRLHGAAAEREACADLCKYIYTEVLDDREGVAKLCEEYILGRNSA